MKPKEQNENIKIKKDKSLRWRLLLIIFSVVLLIWSFPLADVGLLSWIALVPALIAANNAGFRRGLFLGWIFGFVFIYFIVDWLGIFGWEPRLVGSIYFAFFFSLFFGLWGWYSKFIPPASDWKRFLIPPALWVACEWLKGQGVFAFTWGYLGFTQYKFLPLLQLASFTGVFGISFVIAFFNNLLSETIMGLYSYGQNLGIRPWRDFPGKAFWGGMATIFKIITTPGGEAPALRKAILGFTAVFLGVLVYGRYSIPMQTSYGDYESLGGKLLTIGVTQPNFPQYEKWKPENLQETLKVLQEEAKEVADKHAQLVIWPETAIPHRNPLGDPYLSRFITDNARNNNVYLLTGIVDRENDKVYNAAILLSPTGKILQKYRKIQLVPMSEYFPLPEKYRKYKIFDRIGSYTHGKDETVFKIPGVKFSVLICFESMFDQLARSMVRQGAEFLLVITNDSWFLRSNAAKSHFIQSTFRAVENKVWMVQAGNTGVSGVADPWGRVLLETPIFTRCVFVKDIYPQKGGTFYTYAGNWFPVLCAIYVLAIFVVSRIKHRGKRALEDG